MITASKILKSYLSSQEDRNVFLERSNISVATFYKLLNGKEVSADIVAKMLNITGMDFEKAFEVKNAS